MSVLPGQKIAEQEEYISSAGTFSSDTGIYSSNIGALELDAKSHSAKVAVKTRVPRLQGRGTVTLGILIAVSESVAIVDLVPVDSKTQPLVLNGTSAILRVANVKRGYVENLRDEVRVGDIVRVKITDTNEHSTQLTTDGPNLGVVKAFCSMCRQPLKRSEHKLICERCGSTETRKIADDYGSESLR